MRLGELVGKQGRFLLENDYYALLYVAILALIPLATWLSAAIVALITLRKGGINGAKGLIVGITSLLLLYILSVTLSPSGVFNAIMAFLPCFIMALVLRATASWNVTAGFIVLLTLIGIVLIHGLFPEVIEQQYRFIQAVIKEFKREGSISGLFNTQGLNSTVIANYVIGMQGLSFAFSAATALLLARSVQARLFYPGGLRKEMSQFRASSWGVIVLVVTALGAYQNNPLAISCLPILVAYYVCAGISLGFNILAKGKGIGSLFLLLLPLVLLPFVTMPIYVMLGALDSLFNFRSRLRIKAG
jgi:hypothetical protein